MPPSRRAIVKTSPGEARLVSVAIPRIPAGYMLIRTAAVALNPADWTDIDHTSYIGCIVGLDYAGTVVQIGEGVRKPFAVGDRVAGLSHGCNVLQPSYGAFAEYILVKADVQLRIPDGMGWGEAASLGVGVFTAGMGLYHVMGLSLPESGRESESTDKDWMLVYGGSSATGSMVIQLAKLSGFKVVTTCSPRNFDLVKQRGADVWLDYHHPHIFSLIAEATSNSLMHAFDTIATDETAAICAASFAPADTKEGEKAIYVSTLDPTLPASLPRPVEKKYFLGYTLVGEDVLFEDQLLPASEEDYQFALRFGVLVEKLLGEGRLKNHPVATGVGGSGLEGILGGLDVLRRGEVSGKKLVYLLEEL
ncbi:hypothetical protein ASPZODRAFT_128846 [Penicilliopsis zonata CBS 506.65]|uniref:Enoyl reductase (ER) domain-containing protein n=1 Tax=Penicilliopsis zonata CBS 506.65 TaxID=1073090 RepID=A0A1L9SSN6_9EURO|nr:hypothetical protein ASPZODRAFT_128846 [Penicilliopsis zonata CBS 506.65]OJJ50220.1 hypothetical protein ASPZODRAFT_128846 [Penicilliopsis zonata CBS 506.65]